ncbi:GHKL domain-containing protein [Aliihoeflea aestuarii]|uniref:sensor histidine kinase n=1 Tax=Aliihoeflea aestuarii TaxID=453840 RepID=UPI0020955D73|nr:ATP-binding protein [Aliihoeflea aestuarii]MCO6392158.1 GHKL domain-containing protein [Aliihoeflea aestuarii]
MPTANKNFIGATAALLLIGLAALTIIVSMSIWLVELNEEEFDRVLAVRVVRANAVDLRAALQDIETSQRGFLLTASENYLTPYTQSRDDIAPLYTSLVQHARTLPNLTGPVARLGEIIDDKLVELDGTIQLVRDGQQQAAIEILQTDRGKELMDEARAIFASIVQTTDAAYVEAAGNQRSSVDWLRWTTFAGAFIIALVVGSAVWMALRYTRELLNARREVEALNAGLEARIDERTQDLVRANEEVQRFAYIVTHDLRAPLVNIMGFTSELDTTMETIQTYVLADGDPLSEQEIKEARLAASEDLPEAIGFIRSSTRKMDALINAILKISRDGRRPLKPERINLGELIEANANTVQHQVADTDGRINLDIKTPPIVSDRLSLEQIFGNLLDNAVKYRAPDRPVEIDISAHRGPNRRIIIDVKDNGRGIAAQDHQRVFDLFRRAGTQDQAGEGIGLAHVRTLVRNLGGDITLESEFGQGTTFRVTLPEQLPNVDRSN